MKKLSTLAALVMTSSLAMGAASAAVPCIAFVHGHRAGTQSSADMFYRSGTYVEGNWAAGNYWYSGSGNMLSRATNGYAVAFATVNYNTYVAYWDAAKEVAGDLMRVCKTTTNTDMNGSWIISHSMGGAVMGYIMGNSVSGDPYYNYGGANFAGVRAKYSTWFSIAGDFTGFGSADAVMGNSSWTCNSMATIVTWFTDTTRDLGTQSLQHGYGPQYENGSRVTSYLIAGYKGMASSGCLNGEDDGVGEIASEFFCNDQPNDSASIGFDHFCSSLEDVSPMGISCSANPSNKCQSANKARTGYHNYDDGYENHDENRNSLNETSKRRAVADGYWNTHGGNNVVISSSSIDFGWNGSSGTEIGWFVASGYANVTW